MLSSQRARAALAAVLVAILLVNLLVQAPPSSCCSGKMTGCLAACAARVSSAQTASGGCPRCKSEAAAQQNRQDEQQGRAQLRSRCNCGSRGADTQLTLTRAESGSQRLAPSAAPAWKLATPLAFEPASIPTRELCERAAGPPGRHIYQTCCRLLL